MHLYSGVPMHFVSGVDSEPTRIARRDGGELREIFLRDPDGVLVNLSHVGPWE